MVKARFHCLNCGHDFETEVFEEGEAQRRKLPSAPVHCPKCKRCDLREERVNLRAA